nr:expressed conserved protein [Hymenolepis microstoma]CUU99093.1 hypothetical transcript [Hymenolepis microstoma]
MTSNSTDTNNVILTSEKDRGNHNIHLPANPTLEQIQQTQVARKESSSGFMLLSVRHTSNIGSLSNGREMHPLVENFDENYARSASVQTTSNPMMVNKPDISRQFSSTMSLEAEEYDNNEEDDPDLHSEPNQFSHSQQQQQQHFVMRNPPNLIPAGIATMEPPVNGTQIVDGLRPLTVSNLSQIQLSPGVVPIPAAVVQSPQQPPPPIAAVPVIFHQINGHESTLIPVTSLDSLTQLQSAGILSGSIQGPRPSVQLTEIPPFKCSDPSAMPPTVIAITSVASMAGAAQTANLGQGQQRVSAVLNQPSLQHIIDQITAEPLRSVSDASLSNPLLTSLNAPIQPASRFRKARIHETVEQWSSKRISLHDCRLKAVPDWVTYLQSRPIDTTFNHPIAQQGRCLYCFVPGGFGSQCNKHDYSQNFSKFLVGTGSKHHHTRSPACSLPTVPETSEQSHIIQAAFTAYRAATQQGYNLKNLLSTWGSGERSVNKVLLEQFERSISPKTNHNPHILKPNASEPVLASSASTAIQHQHQHIETPSHSSTDVSVNAPIQGNEEFSNGGLTMVAQPTITTQQHHPSEFVPLLEQPQSPRNDASQTHEVSATHVTDPSAAYLRRQITLSSEELETKSNSECVQQVQPPSTLSVAMSDQRSIAPPPASPTQAALLLGRSEQTSGVAPEVSPRSVQSFSGTTIGSVQLSPDTEMSGGVDSGIVVAIPQVPVSSTSGSHNLTNIISSSLDHILSDSGISMITIPQTQAKQQQPPTSAVTMVTAAPAATTTSEFARNITPSIISNLRAATDRHLASATSLDFTAASRNICEAVEAVANAYAPALANGQMNASSPSSMQISLSSPLSQPPHPAMASNSPSSNNNTNATTTSVSGNLQAPVPKCMDVIRGAIMETLQDHYAQLSSEIEALRTTVNSLQQENTQLRTYKQAFDNLCPYLTPETWEQINQQVRAAEVTEGNQAAVAATATAQESIAYQPQPQPQTQHFFPSSNAAATVATVQQQLNSAFQAQQQQQSVNLSPSHISLQPPPPQNSDKTDPQ